MKKLVSFSLLLLLGLLVTTPSFAIRNPDPKGTIIAGFQVGPTIGIAYHYDYDDIDRYLMVGIAPVLTADYVLVDSWWKGHFTVGAMTGASWCSTISHVYHEKEFSLFAAPRAMYGLNLNKQFEVHTGCAFGLGFNWHNGYYSSAGLVWDYITGARWNLSRNFSLTADVHISNALPLLGVGMALKF